LYPQDLSHIPAIVWGREKEATAVSTYIDHHKKNGNGGVTVSKSGFLVSETHPFLGASPDRCVYNPRSPNDPYGFQEIKCPYKYREVSPTLACSDRTSVASLTRTIFSFEAITQILCTSTGTNGHWKAKLV